MLVVRPWQFNFLLDKNAAKTIHVQLFDHLRQIIEEGHLPAGTLLPSTREVAQTLHINRKTVTRVYEELSALGYLTTEPKRGSFVLANIQTPLSTPYVPTLNSQKTDPNINQDLQSRIQNQCLQSIRRVALHFHQLKAHAYDVTGLIALKQLLANQLVSEQGLLMRDNQLICAGFSTLETAVIAWLKQRGGYVLIEPSLPMQTQQQLQLAGINVLQLPFNFSTETVLRLPQLIEQIEKFCINFPITAYWRNGQVATPLEQAVGFYQPLAKTLADYQLWCIDDQRRNVLINPPLTAYYPKMSVLLTSMYGRWCDLFNVYFAVLPEQSSHAFSSLLDKQTQLSGLLTMMAQTDVIKRGMYKKLLQAIKQAERAQHNALQN